jgi:hypothetical protein
MSLSDREQIVDLMTNYARAIDTGDWDRLRSVFLPEGSIHMAGSDPVSPFQNEGVKFFQDWAKTVDVSQHMTAGHSIDVDGDAASVRVNVLGVGVNNSWEGGNTVLVGGVQTLTMKRTADGWRIETLAFTPSWTAGNLAAMMAADPQAS